MDNAISRGGLTAALFRSSGFNGHEWAVWMMHKVGDCNASSLEAFTAEHILLAVGSGPQVSSLNPYEKNMNCRKAVFTVH